MHDRSDARFSLKEVIGIDLASLAVRARRCVMKSFGTSWAVVPIARVLVVAAVALGGQAVAATVAARSDEPPAGLTRYRVLLIQADAFGGVDPTVLRDALLADPDVDDVDFFNGIEGTPTLSQLQAYEIVFTFSNFSDGYQDPVALGDTLADYLDGGGIVVASHHSFNSLPSLSIQGRWLTGGYSPYAYTSAISSNDVTLAPSSGACCHPLMLGVGKLTAGGRLNVAVAPGATQVAAYSDGSSAIAVKDRAVGMPVYLGNLELSGQGDYARAIVNAGRWLTPLTSGRVTVPAERTEPVAVESRGRGRREQP